MIAGVTRQCRKRKIFDRIRLNEPDFADSLGQTDLTWSKRAVSAENLHYIDTSLPPEAAVIRGGGWVGSSSLSRVSTRCGSQLGVARQDQHSPIARGDVHIDNLDSRGFFLDTLRRQTGGHPQGQASFEIPERRPIFAPPSCVDGMLDCRFLPTGHLEPAGRQTADWRTCSQVALTLPSKWVTRWQKNRVRTVDQQESLSLCCHRS